MPARPAPSLRGAGRDLGITKHNFEIIVDHFLRGLESVFTEPGRLQRDYLSDPKRAELLLDLFLKVTAVPYRRQVTTNLQVFPDVPFPVAELVPRCRQTVVYGKGDMTVVRWALVFLLDKTGRRFSRPVAVDLPLAADLMITWILGSRPLNQRGCYFFSKLHAARNNLSADLRGFAHSVAGVYMRPHDMRKLFLYTVNGRYGYGEDALNSVGLVCRHDPTTIRKRYNPDVNEAWFAYRDRSAAVRLDNRRKELQVVATRALVAVYDGGGVWEEHTRAVDLLLSRATSAPEHAVWDNSLEQRGEYKRRAEGKEEEEEEEKKIEPDLATRVGRLLFRAEEDADIWFVGLDVSLTCVAAAAFLYSGLECHQNECGTVRRYFSNQKNSEEEEDEEEEEEKEEEEDNDENTTDETRSFKRRPPLVFTPRQPTRVALGFAIRAPHAKKTKRNTLQGEEEKEPRWSVYPLSEQSLQEENHQYVEGGAAAVAALLHPFFHHRPGGKTRHRVLYISVEAPLSASQTAMSAQNEFTRSVVAQLREGMMLLGGRRVTEHHNFDVAAHTVSAAYTVAGVRPGRQPGNGGVSSIFFASKAKEKLNTASWLPEKFQKPMQKKKRTDGGHKPHPLSDLDDALAVALFDAVSWQLQRAARALPNRS